MVQSRLLQSFEQWVFLLDILPYKSSFEINRTIKNKSILIKCKIQDYHISAVKTPYFTISDKSFPTGTEASEMS